MSTTNQLREALAKCEAVIGQLVEDPANARAILAQGYTGHAREIARAALAATEPSSQLAAQGITLFNADRGWVARDSYADEIAVLPKWCDFTEASELLILLIAHEKRGREQGERVGARAERERIAYGIEVVFAPLTNAAESLQETLNERLSSR